MSFSIPSSGALRGSSRAYGLTATIFTLLLLVIMARLFHLQIVEGEVYKERARISFIAKERVPARRGRILDREARVLAENEPVHRVRLIPHYLDRKDSLVILRRLAVIIDLTDGELQALGDRVIAALDAGERWDPVTVSKILTSDTCPLDRGEAEWLDTPVRRLMDPVTGAWYEPISADATFSPHTREKLEWDSPSRQWATCQRCGRVYVTEPVSPVTGALLRVVEHQLACKGQERTFSDQVAMLRGQLHTMPGVDVTTTFRRRYPHGYEAAHTIGYMNRVTVKDRTENPGVYALTDSIGRKGIERAMEPELRGSTGESLYLKDSRGRRRDLSELGDLDGREAFRNSVPGHDVWLTLDLKLQTEVRRAFRYYKSGGAAVMDPRTGEILALYAKPGFDPNDWSGGLSKATWDQTMANPYTPLLHKGVTAYAPGSVFKIVTATAGLMEGIVTPEMTIQCPGHYDFGGRRFHCHNRSGHGPMNLVDALKVSCDVYFYRVGEMMGIDTLARYGRRFGFGAPSGAEISERLGRVPDRKWHEVNDPLGWQPGFTLSVAIGQGALTASPLQVARAVSALAVGGDVMEASLVSRVIAADGEVLRRASPRVIETLSGAEEALGLIREGLVRVVNDPDGTASEVALERLVFAGKTGTSEAAERRAGASEALARWLEEDHAWFAGYAPAEDPQVVVSVFVEHGGAGSKMAAPIARRIVQAWINLGMYQPYEPGPGDDPLDPDEGGEGTP